MSDSSFKFAGEPLVPGPSSDYDGSTTVQGGPSPSTISLSARFPPLARDRFSSGWRGWVNYVCYSMWSILYTNRAVLFWCSGAIFGSVMQNVYLAETGNYKLPSFPYFVFWSTVIPFNVIFGIALFGVYYFTDEITPAMRSIPHIKFFIIGALNTANGILLLFANPHVPGAVQALLGPSVVTIPMAMLTSYLMLGVRYSWRQISAVIVILGGLSIAIYPSVFQGNARFGTPGWNFIWVAGSVPVVIASVYEELAFANDNIHVVYMMAVSTFYQMWSIFASFPVDAIPGFGTADSVSDIFYKQGRAFTCLGGTPVPDVCPNCECGDAWWNLLLFIVGYVLTNFFSLGVIKYCGATFFYVVSTITLPLSEFAFSWRALLGSDAEVLSSFNYAALAVLFLGVVLYRFAEPRGRGSGDGDESSGDELEDDIDSRLHADHQSPLRQIAAAASVGSDMGGEP